MLGLQDVGLVVSLGLVSEATLMLDLGMSQGCLQHSAGLLLDMQVASTEGRALSCRVCTAVLIRLG